MSSGITWSLPPFHIIAAPAPARSAPYAAPLVILSRAPTHAPNQRRYGSAFFKYFQLHNQKHWVELAPSSINNYITRVLLGEAAFLQPLGSLGEEHLQVSRSGHARTLGARQQRKLLAPSHTPKAACARTNAALDTT